MDNIRIQQDVSRGSANFSLQELRNVIDITQYNRIRAKPSEFHEIETLEHLIWALKESIMPIASNYWRRDCELVDLYKLFSDANKESLRSIKKIIEPIYTTIKMHTVAIDIVKQEDVYDSLEKAIIRMLCSNQFIKKEAKFFNTVKETYITELSNYSYIAAKKTLNHFTESVVDISLSGIIQYAKDMDERYARLFCNVNFILSYV